MKKATLMFAVILAIVAFSPAHSREIQPSVVHANLTSVSGPVAFSPVLHMAGGMVYGASAQIQQAPEAPKLDVDVNIDKGGDRRWAISPVWMAIGGLALLVLIALVVMGSRREGGTTVVRG